MFLKPNFEFDPSQLFVVGIAASAGGIPPMKDLLTHASCHGSMSFVVISHLDRWKPSDLKSILMKASRIDSVEISEGLEIENCRLYVLPPGQYVRVEKGRFRMEPRPNGVPNNAADFFFKSLADSFKENAIGVVLSGASVGADGSQGVIAIKNQGGHTYAQTPETAQFPDMPELAIKTGCVDTVSDPEQIGHDLSLVAWANESSRK